MKKGFTLIELLIVVVIIGVLSTLLLANFVGIRARARDGLRKGDLRQIQAALEFWRTDKGTYPSNITNTQTGELTCTGGLIETTTNTTYMKKIPCDPLTKLGYFYFVSNIGSSYRLVACLENGNDPDGLPSPPSGSPTIPAETCTGTTARYYVLENP